MFSSSQLSDQQKQGLVEWAAEGASIAELQRRLKEDFSISVTYMDARLLVLDLGIEILEPQKEEPDVEAGKAVGEAGVAGDAGDATPVDEVAGGLGGVRVAVDELAVPGALVSGKVTFSDGEKAVWMLDQMGRPGLDPDTAGYRPSEQDITEFQVKLREVLSKATG